MTALRLTWIDPDVETRISEGYDQQKIERDVAGGGAGPWVELSRATTRPPLRTGVEEYVYADPSGDSTYFYRVVYRKSSDGTEYGTPYTSVTATEDTYCTLAEVRDEGVVAALATDAQVNRAIAWANDYIERYTGRFFRPRYMRKMFDGGGEGETLLVGADPLIALLALEADDLAVDPAQVAVYNRHLRGEQIDDRPVPRIGVVDEIVYLDNERRIPWIRWFAQGVQHIKIHGIWGYTELPRGSVPGETVDGSEVPLSYGDPPSLINWAARALAVQRCFSLYGGGAGGSGATGAVRRLKTRDQEVEFQTSDAAAAAANTWAVDPAILDVLDGFRRMVTVTAV